MPYKTMDDKDWHYTIGEKVRMRVASVILGHKLWHFLFARLREEGIMPPLKGGKR